MRPAGDLFAKSPFIVFWETTRACDLVCQHCRACAIPSRSPDELSTEEGKALLSEVREMGCPIVVLTGGDPAKRPDLLELVRYGNEIGLRMALTPSATPLITEDLLRELRDAGLARIAISLDGATAEAHDRFRGVPGSFDRTFEILRTARRLGLTTQINTTVTEHDVDELETIADMCAGLGVELWSVFLLVPTGRGVDLDILDPDRVEGVLHRLAAIAESAPFDVKTTAAPHFRRVLLQNKVAKNEIAGLADGIGRAPRGVNDGQGIAFVSHVGDIFPSGFLPLKCGNVREGGLTRVYRMHPLFRGLRDPDQLGGKCGVCEFRKVCGGSRARAYAMNGDVLSYDPSCAYEPRKWSPSSAEQEGAATGAG